MGARVRAPRLNDRDAAIFRDGVTERSEVKGLWFTTARRFMLDAHGRDALAAVIEDIPEEHRRALAAPLPSQWYPEETLQESLGAASRVMARGSRDKMLELLEGCSIVGVNHFFRIALRITTTTFALRMLPTTWTHMRRGPGRMSVDLRAGEGIIDYADFPYFGDLNYRLLVLGTLRPLLRMSTGREPNVEIERYDKSSLRAIVRFGREGWDVT
jgi:hypothetical protein